LNSVDNPTPEEATWPKRAIGMLFARTIIDGSTNPRMTAATPASSS